MKTPRTENWILAIILCSLVFGMTGVTFRVMAQPSTAQVVDAPRKIVEAVHGSAFVGSGSFISNAPVSSVFGCSHEVWFRISEAVVNHSSGDVLRVFVDCLKHDPGAGFGSMPQQPGSEADKWGAAFKLIHGKTYHVVVVSMSQPNQYLLLDKLVSDEDWPVFRQDILDAKAGTYVWRDPVELKRREWSKAVEELRDLHRQRLNGQISGEDWRVAAERTSRLFDEYKAIRGTNTAIRCP